MLQFIKLLLSNAYQGLVGYVLPGAIFLLMSPLFPQHFFSAIRKITYPEDFLSFLIFPFFAYLFGRILYEIARLLFVVVKISAYWVTKKISDIAFLNRAFMKKVFVSVNSYLKPLPSLENVLIDFFEEDTPLSRWYRKQYVTVLLFHSLFGASIVSFFLSQDNQKDFFLFVGALLFAVVLLVRKHFYNAQSGIAQSEMESVKS